MPHLVIDYSPNLGDLVDIPAVLEAGRRAMVETGIFPLGGIRVRAHRADHAIVADGDPRHAHLAAELRNGPGRDRETQKRAGEHLFSALSAALEPAFARTSVALSLEIRELDAELGWKRNTVHGAVAAHG